MTNWLLPSLIATLTGTAILASIYSYLAAVEQHSFIKKWALGWWIYALRFAFAIAILAVSPFPILMIGSQVAALISGVFLLWGTCEFLNRKMPPYWFIVAGVILVWIILGVLFHISFLLYTIPTFLFLGFIYIRTGIAFLQSFSERWFVVSLTGYSFIVWGIHKMNYPFLRMVEWFAPLGYFLAAVLEIIVALGLLLIYFQKTKKELRLSLNALQRSRDEIDALLQGNQAVLHENDFSSAARKIFEYCSQVTGATDGYVELLTPPGGEREKLFFDTSASSWPFSARLQEPFKELRAEAYGTGKIVYRNDFHYSSLNRAMTDGELVAENVLFAPLHIENNAVGLLGIANKKEGFTKHDARMVEAFAELLAIALRNRRYIAHIKKSEEKFAKSFHNSPLLMAISDLKTGRLIDVNRRFIELTGYAREEVIGKSSVELGLINAQQRNFLVTVLEKEGFINGLEMELRNKDREPVTCIYFGEIVEYGESPSLLSILQDVTEERRAERERSDIEARLRQAQKMEAIGTLAGGIAHDFNNILGVIFGYTDMVLETAPPDAEYVKHLQKVRKAGERARDLVKQILTFSRQSDVERRPLKPQLIVKEALKMLRSSIPTTIELREDISPQCSYIYADPTRFHQIIMNLATNAYQAMEDKGGVLQVELKTAESIPENLFLNSVSPQDYMEMVISDTGEGIRPEIIDKIFDPFFTTKEEGRGTGMGLATVYGIVKDYEGELTVESQVGQGTTFHVYLPQNRQEDTAVQLSAGEDAIQGGKERILFVDDEQMMVDMVKDMLGSLGYDVKGQQDSSAALEMVRKHPEDFDLVITDQTMPGMTGLELASYILEIRPDMPIILCSGYKRRHMDEEFVRAKGIREFAMKPLTKKDLAGLIRKVLNSS